MNLFLYVFMYNNETFMVHKLSFCAYWIEHWTVNLSYICLPSPFIIDSIMYCFALLMWLTLTTYIGEWPSYRMEHLWNTNMFSVRGIWSAYNFNWDLLVLFFSILLLRKANWIQYLLELFSQMKRDDGWNVWTHWRIWVYPWSRASR